MKDIEKIAFDVITEAYRKASNLTLLCSFGKDSQVLLHMLKICGFLKRTKILYIDSTFEFKELYEHRDFLLKKYDISYGNFIIAKNKEAIVDGLNYNNTPIFELTEKLKTIPLNQSINQHNIDFLITGIRRDEEGSRAKERYFSVRDENGRYNPIDNKPEFFPILGKNLYPLKNGGHYRVNPLLDWTEYDIWEYINEYGLKVCPLYFSKNGKRYRSLGDAPVTTPIESNACTPEEIILELAATKTPERASRALQDNATPYCMEKLRQNGFC